MQKAAPQYAPVQRPPFAPIESEPFQLDSSYPAFRGACCSGRAGNDQALARTWFRSAVLYPARKEGGAYAAMACHQRRLPQGWWRNNQVTICEAASTSPHTYTYTYTYTYLGPYHIYTHFQTRIRIRTRILPHPRSHSQLSEPHITCIKH